MAVDLAAFSYSPKGYLYNNKNKFPFNPKAYYLVIRFPSSQTMTIFYRLLLLALIVASFPLISSSFVSRNSPNDNVLPQRQQQSNSFDSVNMDQLSTLLFNDLTSEGLFKKTHHLKAIFLGDQELQEGFSFQVFKDYNMDYISINDMEKQNSILNDTVDFIFTYNFPESSQFIDRTLKTNGIVSMLINAIFQKPSNYKIAYMRRFEKVVMAMKKTGLPPLKSETKFVSQRKLCGYLPEAKKAALQKLEDVLLEPPRAASGKSRVYLKRTKYLPDLMGDTLESYPRRVFIDVGLPEKDGGSGTDWFGKNYPTRNKNFEMYKIETVAEGLEAAQVEMSDWLRKNVKEEEYVVMKAEAEVVEEMMRSKAIMLVDELFLECKPHGMNLKQGNKGRTRRAYWECLALYGKLRDEGVAVHQWWG